LVLISKRAIKPPIKIIKMFLRDMIRFPYVEFVAT
jgi:hypothetical protein